jgi:hypothetical protein
MLDVLSLGLPVNNFFLQLGLKAARRSSRLNDADFGGGHDRRPESKKFSSDFRREQHEGCYPPVSESDKFEHKRERKIVCVRLSRQ